MNDKTRAKIEAMAEKEYGSLDSRGDAHEEGATLWAEWCERLVEEIEMTMDCHKPTYYCNRCKEDVVGVLKEYSQWLEDVDD